MAPISEHPEFNASEPRSDGQAPKLHFLYHALSEGLSGASYTLTVDQFRSHVCVFKSARNHDGFIFWPDVTFDDGHISNLKQGLPVLEEYGFSAQFFITVGWTGKRKGYMGWSDLRMLAERGQTIGSHGWSHSFLTDCSQRELNQELVASRLMLEDKLGIEVRTMACPGGRYSKRVLAACKEAGYSRVYTSAPQIQKNLSEFLVGRVNARSNMTADVVSQLLLPHSKALHTLERRYFLKKLAKNLLTNRLYDALWWKFNSQRGADTDLERDEDIARYQQ